MEWFQGPALFKPVRIGRLTLAHRVILISLMRFRANEQHIRGNFAVECYAQRAGCREHC